MADEDVAFKAALTHTLQCNHLVMIKTNTLTQDRYLFLQVEKPFWKDCRKLYSVNSSIPAYFKGKPGL